MPKPFKKSCDIWPPLKHPNIIPKHTQQGFMIFIKYGTNSSHGSRQSAEGVILHLAEPSENVWASPDTILYTTLPSPLHKSHHAPPLICYLSQCVLVV